MILGRMTRAFDNRQGIQDPRVSRQHLRLILAQGEAHEPNGVCRVQALGHNPSTIRRGKLASLGVGFHAEPPSFKLRRALLFAPAVHSPPLLSLSIPLPRAPQAIIRRLAPPHTCVSPLFVNMCAGGDMATLYPGDIIQLVCEDVSRAHGRSLPYEGNACAYKLDYLSERCLEDLPDGTVILGREAEETSDEGSEAGGSSPEQAPQPSHQATQQLVVEEVN